MTTDKFIYAIQAYYCKYRKEQLTYIRQYLNARTDRYRRHLFSETLHYYSSKWGTPPDIAIFEEVRKKVEETLMDEAQRRPKLPQPVDEKTRNEISGLVSKLANRLRGKE